MNLEDTSDHPSGISSKRRILRSRWYHQSEIQKFEGVIQTLLAEMRGMKQEDEGSEIRIQELERQRDTACLAMRHMTYESGESGDEKRLRVGYDKD